MPTKCVSKRGCQILGQCSCDQRKATVFAKQVVVGCIGHGSRAIHDDIKRVRNVFEVCNSIVNAVLGPIFTQKVMICRGCDGRDMRAHVTGDLNRCDTNRACRCIHQNTLAPLKIYLFNEM